MTDNDPIPRKKLDQYRKLKTVAAAESATDNERAVAARLVAKMEKRYPRIASITERIERKETAQASRQGAPAVNYPREPTREEIEAMIPDVMRKVADRLGFGLVDVTQSALSWAIGQIDEAIDEYTWASYAHGDDTIQEGMLMLSEQIEEEIEIEIREEDGETDDGVNITLVCIELAVPEDLWNRIAKSKTGGKKLIDWVNKLYMEGGGGIDD